MESIVGGFFPSFEQKCILLCRHNQEGWWQQHLAENLQRVHLLKVVVAFSWKMHCTHLIRNCLGNNWHVERSCVAVLEDMLWDHRLAVLGHPSQRN